MARPGSPDARRLTGRARDLSLVRMSDEQARDLQEKIELKLGARCRGCGRRVTIGFRFTSIDPRDDSGQVVQMTACAREDCDFAERAREGATFIEPVEYAWVDGNGPDAPAAVSVVARNERMAREAAAAGNGAEERAA